MTFSWSNKTLIAAAMSLAIAGSAGAALAQSGTVVYYSSGGAKLSRAMV